MLLLIGGACIAIGEFNLSRATLVENARSGDKVWYYGFNLTTGKTYRLRIESSQKWGALWGNGTFDTALPVNVTITSPGGDATSLQAFFFGLAASNPLYREGTPPTIIEVRYQNVDYASLSVDQSFALIRFSVKQDGLYVARVLQEGLWTTDPPQRFIILEEFVANRDTYSLLAFGGGVLGAVGGVALVVGIFRRKKLKPKRLHK